MRTEAITKELSANDTGETGGHQAGILVPKEPAILSFFPALDPGEYNPRHQLFFVDPAGEKWKFVFIYYNNKLFGGTRNEYRLTGMTRFYRAHNLKSGDSLLLRRGEDARYTIDYKRKVELRVREGEPLKLGSSWKVIPI